MRLAYGFVPPVGKRKVASAKRLRQCSQILVRDIAPDSKCYDEASVLYKKIEQEGCNQALGAAKGAWAALDAIQAAEYLSQISASCDCFAEAEKLQAEIQTKVREDQKREWERRIIKEDREYALQNKRIDSEVEIAKATLEAASTIATAAIENKAYGWGYYTDWTATIVQTSLLFVWTMYL